MSAEEFVIVQPEESSEDEEEEEDETGSEDDEEEEEKEDSIPTIQLQTNMHKPASANNEPAQEKHLDMMKSIFSNFKSKAQEILMDKQRGSQANEVGLADADQPTEVYTEIVRNQDQTSQVNVSWNLKNMSSRFDWS